MDQYNVAYNFAKAYADSKFRPFLCEEIQVKFDEAHPGNKFDYWGGIMRDLNAAGVIIENRFVRSKKRPSRIVTEWISKVYSDTQRQNRESEEARKSRESQNSLF